MADSVMRRPFVGQRGFEGIGKLFNLLAQRLELPAGVDIEIKIQQV